VSAIARPFAIAALLAMTVACGSSGVSAGSSERYDGSPGPFRVAEGGEVILHDYRRAKDLRVTVSFPSGDGPFPVIVFSHGAGGNGHYPYPLTRFWTSHGYVCLHPTHADSISLGPAPGLAGPLEWENRARDLSFVLDSLEELASKVPALAGKMDAARIGVAGYSYGGHSAQLLGGATIRAPEESPPRSLSDSRPRAFLILSGPGSGARGLTEESWEPWTRPMMAVTGSRDLVGGERTPMWHLEPFFRSPAGDKYALFLEGASHRSFMGRQAELEDTAEEREIFRWVLVETLAFWDLYMKDATAAKPWLEPERVAEFSGGRAKLQRK
jgi:predicted dienelactone hydrolase